MVDPVFPYPGSNVTSPVWARSFWMSIPRSPSLPTTTSSSIVVSPQVKVADFSLTEKRGLKWYRSSTSAKRGFCAECGSSLLWDDGGDHVHVSAGSLDQPTGLSLATHIFVDDKGDYYEIADGLETFPAGHGG